MTCKNCGDNINFAHNSCLTKELIKHYKNIKEEIPSILSNVYKEHRRVYCCAKCNKEIDFKDMPLNMFFSWLKQSSEDGDSREASGKAIIRYFELDKLLKLKKRRWFR